jgi:uncharacterized membrane protein
MPFVRRTVLIRADQQAVFDLLCQVEDFSQYWDRIEAIRRIGPHTYRWTVRLAGMELEWDSVISDALPPTLLTWQSVGGVDNCGEFRLTPVSAGTRLDFTMSYRLPSRLLERVMDGVVGTAGERVADQILARIRRRLEQAAPAADK